MIKDESTSMFPREVPYHQTPGVDFFLYPPVHPSTPEEKHSLSNKLNLDQPMPDPGLFSVFVSIPYCRSRCHSCHFFKQLLPSHADQESLLGEYLEALENQIEKYAATARFSTGCCGAVYIGGGTASLISPPQFTRLMDAIRGSFAVDPELEITLEGNPRDFSLEYLQNAKQSGVTRLSIGVQSFQDTFLKVVGSSHTGALSHEAVTNALSTGFDTLNIDLLYNLPEQSITDWISDLRTALSFDPQSLTIYAYVIHPGSSADRLIEQGRLGKPVDKKKAYQWYVWTKLFLEQKGYVEAMNGYFSKPGHEKRYGVLNYKSCLEYIGLGAGSYSFIDRRQFSTGVDPEAYKEQVRQGLFPVADCISAPATDQNMMERYVIFNFFSFRLDRPAFFRRFGADPLSVFPAQFAKLEQYGLATISDTVIVLTGLGKKWRDSVLYEFYSDEFKAGQEPGMN